MKWGVRAAMAVVGVGVVYVAATFAQVWAASRQDQARPVQAIVVLGAAQYNGAPSPDLRARLDHAYDLWKRNLSDVIVVTGGKQPGDRFTEATAAADYLAAKGVPQRAILREVSGRNSWQSLESTSAFLMAQQRVTVLLVSDPFHDKRIALMAGELGLKPFVSPTRTSPLGVGAKVTNYAKETGEVAVGRIIGFRHLVDLNARLLG
ncbi:MAG: YdcF family protein [Actinomycetota bacterium]|nr:YdcF family protein [Actinomycetota bacterium]